MRTILCILLLASALPSRAEVIASLLGCVPESSRCVVVWRLQPRVLYPQLAGQFDEFARQTGLDPAAEVTLVAAVNYPLGDDPGVLMGQVMVQTSALAQLAKTLYPKAPVKESAGELELLGGSLVVLKDGTFFAGKPAAVKAARSLFPKGGSTSELARTVAARTSREAPFAAAWSLPPGMALPALDLAPPAIAALGPRLRGGFAGLLETDVTFTLTFDSAAESAAGRAEALTGLDQLRAGLEKDEASAAQQARTLAGPLAGLDAKWMAARLALESFKDLQAGLTVTATGNELTCRVPHGLQGSPALAAMPMIGVLAGIAIPNFRSARARANLRACHANQRVIRGAIEMYELDLNTKATKMDGLMVTLKEKGYLSSVPQDPGQGEGSVTNYYMPATGGVACKIHGSAP